MTIGQHLDEYAGLPVFDFNPETKREGLPEAGSVAWRVRTEFDEEEFGALFGRFLEWVDASQVTALVIGYWNMHDSTPTEPLGPLVAAADKLPSLRSLFIGDIVLEESEVSWIELDDINPVFKAFPLLERFGVRGSEGLALQPVQSEHLKELRFETGGLPSEIVRAVAASDLPNLESLVLWLGTDNYGGDVTVADLAPILSGERLPSLRHLGLENAEIQDEVAAAVATAPILARLESLSLALGALSDEGAEALLSGQPLTHLRSLDLHHHFLSTEMMQRVRAALPGVQVDLGDQENADDPEDRYIMVSE